LKTPLTRHNKEKLVVKLQKEGMTYAQIAKEAHVSLRDIGPILSKAGVQQSQSTLSRAIELYDKQSTPLEVVKELGLEADEAIRLHREYFKLLGCNDFTKVYLQIKDNPWPYVNFVKLAQNSGMSDDEVIKLLEMTKDYPRVTSRYEKLKADTNVLENEISNLAKVRPRLSDSISNLRKSENQLQLTIKGLQAKQAKLKLQQIRTENFVKQYQDENAEYSKVKKAIKGQLEYVLADRRQLIGMAVQAVIELLRKDPQKFLSLHYNRSTIHAENDDPILIEAEQLYEKMLENITNKVVTNLSEDLSSMSSFAQNELRGEQGFHPNFESENNTE
jgi:hypothetical protein